MVALQARPRESDADALDILGVANRLRVRLVAALEPVGLTYAEYRLLARLGRSEGPVDIACLAGCGEVDRGRATQSRLETPDAGRAGERLLSDLESEGLIRVSELGPGREPHAQLTETGCARLCEASKRLEEPAGEFASAFSARERVALGRLLERIARGRGGGCGRHSGVISG